MNNYKLTFKVDEFESKKAFTLLSISPKYVYKDGSRTEEHNGYTLTFMSEEGSLLKCHMDTDVRPNFDRFDEYYLTFDNQKTRPYAMNGFVNWTVWIKSVNKVTTKAGGSNEN